MDDAMQANRDVWDAWTKIHLGSAFYDVPSFRSGERPIRLADYELDEVGDVTGRTLLHLQCHFGLDTLSWARLGARVTGLDFSAPAIEAACRLAVDIGVEADLYDAVTALEGRTFDVVYTGKGALIWLPDIARWAAVCAALVAPGGTF